VIDVYYIKISSVNPSQPSLSNTLQLKDLQTFNN
jgi:hypothetical protein